MMRSVARYLIIKDLTPSLLTPSLGERMRAARGERVGIGVRRWDTGGVSGGTLKIPAMMPAPHEVWIGVEPIDMRAGIDGLSLRIQEALGRSPCDGSAYAFRTRALGKPLIG